MLNDPSADDMMENRHPYHSPLRTEILPVLKKKKKRKKYEKKERTSCYSEAKLLVEVLYFRKQGSRDVFIQYFFQRLCILHGYFLYLLLENPHFQTDVTAAKVSLRCPIYRLCFVIVNSYLQSKRLGSVKLLIC